MSTDIPIKRHMMAIDPLAILLPDDVYVSINLPRPTETNLAKIKAAVAKMSPEEKATTLKNAKAMSTYMQKVVKTIEEI